MEFLTESLVSALKMLVSLDPEMTGILFLSLKISTASTAVSTLFGVPAGFVIAFLDFKGKRLLLTVLNSLLALPTVVIGLFVYAFIARRGLFGSLDLLYTPAAVVTGQVILILPVVMTFTISAISRIDTRYRKTAQTLGANFGRTAWVVLREARFGVMAAIIAAFGRVISEVGISMMLGGNIKGFTRTITTAMALEYDRGEFSLSIALGILLMLISFGINLVFHVAQGRMEN